ncbi:MAG TPA: hypothetical protein VE645_19445 [Pseudonocardiaceae bacterium]|nr:hypothetical protein [Pseudonocardiaceae bacterium]
MIVAREGFGVLRELLEGHASLPDALFEQGAWLPIDHELAYLAGGFVACGWRDGVVSLKPIPVHDYFSSSPR